MKILGIETSCDETALAIIDGEMKNDHPVFNIVGEAIHSQIETHREFGGVFPTMAKREHEQNIVPLFNSLLENSNLKHGADENLIDENLEQKIREIFSHEKILVEEFIKYFSKIKKPDIDAISVTYGPGLEPALWVGINFAEALSVLWNIPVWPINHMEGHIFSVINSAENLEKNSVLNFPALALLISGGHTEIILVKNYGDYELVGKTKDDAVGEAFDKVARILGLSYPGGPEISKLAMNAVLENLLQSPEAEQIKLPRPMLNSDDLDFSFSGLKTAVLYLVQKIKSDPQFDQEKFDNETRKIIAEEFENAVTEVIFKKTLKALDQFSVKSLIIGGGVIANKKIRETFQKLEKEGISVLIPPHKLTTDNAVMIAIAGLIKSDKPAEKTIEKIIAKGNLSL